MPFDGCAAGVTCESTKITKRPSLKILATLLRDRTTWPEGFKWDYGTYDTCALGLAVAVWGAGEIPIPLGMETARRMFPKVSATNRRRIFLDAGGHATLSMMLDCAERRVERVPPERVADVIDACLEAA